ncbi:epimerase [beta proteobacterium AAP121]|nr:epimerase [beta proteobacterium AAP65]KPF95610.1 epimerase [beta proteobacterium AAP121]
MLRRLLAAGWRVRTTWREPAREAALRALLRAPLFGEPGVDDTALQGFVADLNADAGWAEAAAGCSHVLHVASPLPVGQPRDAMALIGPAREGTLRVLRAARAAGVQRVVMTSSTAAIAYGRGRGVHHFTEADWTPDDFPGATPYIRSKTLAERAARAWVAAEGGGLEFCSINPSVVLGPVWGADHSASVEIVKRLLDGSLPACPDIGFGVVDARDVADLHWRALTAPGLAGERFIASGRFMKLFELAQLLRRELRADARRVTRWRLPDALVRLAAPFHPQVRAVAGELGAERHASSAHALAVLGWQPRAVEDTVLDTARCLLALGLVRR